MSPSGFRRLPRLVIAAPQGRSGKTTLTLGLCAAFKRRGFVVQPFKKGPDYIDPSWLSEASGRPCRSLDPFFYPTSEGLTRACLLGSGSADLVVIEGNHGLFDSLDENGQGSTAAVARMLQAPILFVVNAARMGRSAAALVHGYQTFEPGTPLAGVILNNVSSIGSRHEKKLQDAIECHCGIPVLGALPRDEALIIPDRHLGLVPRSENQELLGALDACRQAAEKYLDLDRILEIAQKAENLKLPAEPGSRSGDPIPNESGRPEPVSIGVLQDRAFSFYYPENLEALQGAGARLIFIDSLSCPSLPEISGLYIGGGFPEVFMEELSANRSLREEIRRAVEAGLPVYAECGGLMYLSRKIHWQGRQAEMVGALPFEVEVTERPQGHGYVLARTRQETPFFPAGIELRGHEFHHSRVVSCSEDLPTAYELKRGSGLGNKRDGFVYRNVLASYTHLHTGGAPGWAAGLAARARAYRQGSKVR